MSEANADDIDPSRLWCGWRNAYVSASEERKLEAAADPRSVFTRMLASGAPDDQTLIVHRGELCFAVLNNFPYSPGHTMVLPYREVANLEDLTPEEHAEVWATVTDGVRAIKAAYNPNAMNVGINLGKAAGGSVGQHLHVHIVPRWVGDANFMTATGWTRTIPEALPDTWAKVRAAWVPGEAAR